MSDSQKQTIDLYQSLFEAMSLAASLDAAVQSGVFEALRGGQKNLQELAVACQCDPDSLAQLLRVLRAVGAVEQYGEDLALAQAVQLIVPVDRDLGGQLWQTLPAFLSGQVADRQSLDGQSSTTDGQAARPSNFSSYRERVSTRQWSHTAAAMQAADVLNIGVALRGLNVLDLGGGAGVWSAAMAYRDPKLRVTVVDNAPLLTLCRATFDSIDLLDRITLIEDDYRTWSTPLGQFDMVLLPEVVQLEQDATAVILLGRAADALRVGGQVVIIETLNESDGPAMPLATQALEVAVATGGRQRTAKQLQQLLRGAGFGDAQWGWLTADSRGLGLVIATKDKEVT